MRENNSPGSDSVNLLKRRPVLHIGKTDIFVKRKSEKSQDKVAKYQSVLVSWFL